MSKLTDLFPALQDNAIYAHPGWIIRDGMCSELDLILDVIEQVLGQSYDNCTGDYIILALKRAGELDLVRELRTAITIYNSEVER